MKYFKLLFGLRERVNRRDYFRAGFLLMLLKYAGEIVIYYFAKGEILQPINFLSPFITFRYPEFQSFGDWFIPATLFWSMPFIWIGVGMSIRRSADAGLSPWFGILFFIPVVNYLLMLVLSVIDSSEKGTWQDREERINRSPFNLQALSISLGFGIMGTILVWLDANFSQAYTQALFIASPLVLGLTQGYWLSRQYAMSFWRTILYVNSSIILVHLFLMLMALEGAICLAMSLPFGIALATIGAVFGAAIWRFGRAKPTMPALMVLVLPIMPIAEKNFVQPHQDMVLSTIEIDAPPEQVWPNVVKFSDLPPTEDWLFKLGVAYPVRARIEGEGVGAIRRCEFSTGAFVEPITIWDAPHHLAFEVRFQPPPMTELSIYDHVDAPHLNGYFRSVRGEFRLVRLTGNRTRLEGRTWYEVDIHPGWYWQIYGRWFIHKIHLRVLDHIQNLSEST